MNRNPEDYERDNEFDLAGIAYEDMVEQHKQTGVYLEYTLDGKKLTAVVLQKEEISFLITKHNLTLYRPLSRQQRKTWQGKKKVKKKVGFIKRNQPGINRKIV